MAPTNFQVAFQSNLDDVIALQDESAREAALAAAQVIARHARKDLRNGAFKPGTGKDSADHAENITAAWNPNAEEARAGLPESGAPDEAPYYRYWQHGFLSEWSNQWERNPWLTNAQRKTRTEQAQAAVDAASTVFEKGSITGVRSFGTLGRGFSLIAAAEIVL